MISPPPFRALAIDIDGTLINSRKLIPEFTKSEIRRVVREYATEVFLVTARGPQSTAVIEDQLGVKASYATFGGALVWARNDAGFKTLSETALLATDVTSIITASAGLDVHIGIYTRDEWFVSELNYWGLREARNTAVWPTVAPIQSDYIDPNWGPVFKIMFRGETKHLAALHARIHSLADTAFAHHSGHVLEIIAAAAVKLPALKLLLSHHGLDLRQTIAFGDSMADREILEHAGAGILMGNANVDVASGPNVERTLSNDEDGIGVILRKYFPTDQPFLP